MLTLLLVRHATTAANETGVWIGHGESEISERGKEELAGLRMQLKPWKIKKVFVSPSLRTQETVQAVLNGQITIQHEEALREIHFGDFEERNYAWVQRHRPEEAERMIQEGNAYCYPGGESLIMAHQRVAKWLREWLALKPEGNYMICAHGGTLRSILSELLSHDERLHWHFKIDPASLSIVTIQGDFPVIEALNKR